MTLALPYLILVAVVGSVLFGALWYWKKHGVI